MKYLIATLAITVCSLQYMPDTAAQAPARRQFEVASIKPSPYAGQGPIGIRTSGRQLEVHHQPVAEMVLYAYSLLEQQLSGGPAWVYSRNLMGADVYDVVAQGAGDSVPTDREFREMLQSLLQERFTLTLRRDMKPLPVFTLTVGPRGSRMKTAARDPNAPTFVWRAGRLENSYEANGMPISDLLFMLRMTTSRPVVDKTGLTGTYAFTLRYADDPPPPEATAPSIFTAVQEQLGLKLDAATEPFEVFVIERVERPTPN